MQTNFSSQTLAEQFRDLYLGEKSGVLHLSRGTQDKRIYFDRGMILYAESSEDDEDLGKRLVAEGKISSGALAEARRNISEPKDLAQALLNRGLIAKEPLSHTVRYIVDRVVQSVFRWEGGSAKFSEGWLLQEIFESDIVSTFEVILRAIGGMAGFEPVKDALLGLDQKLKIRTPSPVPLERLALTPSHGFILSRIDGSTTVSDVIALAPAGEDDVATRFLYGLLVMGVLVLDPPVGEGPFHVATILRDHADQLALERVQETMIAEAYDGLREKNPSDILGVEPNAAREEVERAYEEAKERFGRERILPRVRERLRSELAIIESRLIEAYLTLTQAKTPDSGRSARGEDEGAAPEPSSASDLLVRVELDKTKTKRAIEESSRMAELYFGKARRFSRDGDFHNAIQYCKLAISYRAEDARFYFLLGECQARNPENRWQRQAEQNFLKSTELDPWNAEYRMTLGRLYRRQGLNLRARKQFEEALAIVPGHEEASAELKALG